MSCKSEMKEFQYVEDQMVELIAEHPNLSPEELARKICHEEILPLIKYLSGW